MQLFSYIKAFLSTPLFNNLRAMLYVAVPAVLLELVKDGRLSQDRATLWSAVAIAALSPALATVFAPAGWRTYVSGLLIPVQALLVGIGGANNLWALMGAAVIGSIVSSGLWAANVHNAAAAPPAAADTARSGE
ncbi:phage holin [Mycobacterium intracellulare]|uniref:Holin n=1 Tax=Mycobacterium intracellulare TaxID=1767 RepID=A0AAE4UD58_MYCIT|nr:hypothetical protein [Mycobacterium intracellulare]MDV6979675.1 hypothetical protein [Mycobacterium intracellulare]MDV6985178.1 hypothetical protein [Mycobacterium intracellulare]MDV7014202.1 hypothetical protein [Mycobacterium intracellulare]MDV7030169.1 hypothetical protein [Mycobacterium intracellulare]